MATDTPLGNQSPAIHGPSFLAPVEKPNGIRMKVMYLFARRQWGIVPRPFSVFCARMPMAFTSFFGKVSRLDKKLELSADTAMLIRKRVAGLNMCLWCMDGQRWFALHKAPHNLAKLDALVQHRTSPLFDDKERAALEFATELTENKQSARDVRRAVAPPLGARDLRDRLAGVE